MTRRSGATGRRPSELSGRQPGEPVAADRSSYDPSLHEAPTASPPTPGGDPRRAATELAEWAGLPVSVELLAQALTHRSYAYEHGGLPTNERLEFLGDAVLGLVITDTLYHRHPDLPEGQLARLRAAVVNMRALAEASAHLDLGRWVSLGRGEEATGGRSKPSILADTLEAVIGAVYLEAGLEGAAALVHRLLDPLIETSQARGAGLDWKTSLQELTAQAERPAPVYELQDSGPDHAKVFSAVVRVGDRVYGEGTGPSKKLAEQQAAAAAWAALHAEVAEVADNVDHEADEPNAAGRG